jgi:hypothetical protein
MREISEGSPRASDSVQISLDDFSFRSMSLSVANSSQLPRCMSSCLPASGRLFRLDP